MWWVIPPIVLYPRGGQTPALGGVGVASASTRRRGRVEVWSGALSSFELTTTLRASRSEIDHQRAFEFDYRPGKILCRPGCIADLGAELDRRGLNRALLMCGFAVGSTHGVMNPVRGGLGDRVVSVFDETTPTKYLQTHCRGRTGRPRGGYRHARGGGLQKFARHRQCGEGVVWAKYGYSQRFLTPGMDAADST